MGATQPSKPYPVAKQLTNAAHLFTIHLDVCHVVLKYSGHIDLRKLIFAEDNEQTGLPAGTVAHNHQLLTDGSHACTRVLHTIRKVINSRLQMSSHLEALMCVGPGGHFQRNLYKPKYLIVQTKKKKSCSYG